MTLTVGELFAGYGGLGLAVEEVFGAELAWYAEFDAAPSKIMAHHYPDLTNYGDVTTADWANVPPVDIISGGSPCQDLSLAGARKGMSDGTRSNLWESMREAIATIQPTYVVWENVRGALSATATSASDMGPREGFLDQRGGHLRALGRVLGDLADLGFDAEWRGLRAADAGAPHGRFRVFVLATRRGAELAHTDNTGLEGQRNPNGTAPTKRYGHVGSGTSERPAKRGHDGRTRGADGRFAPLAPDAGMHGCERSEERHGEPEAGSKVQFGDDADRRVGSDVNWGPYAPAIARWEAVRGTAPAPTELTVKGKYRLSADFAAWMMGIPADWVTDPAIGISRNEQLKAIGNGVVPAQAAEALRHMLAAEQPIRLAA